MQIIQFTILIDANNQKVWNTMLDNKTYPEWTKEFNPTSSYVGSWDKGSEIRFVGVNDDGKQEGMFSHIKENIPHRFISIEHLGLITNGVVDTTSEQVKKWAPSFENYTFTPKGNKTELKVEMQVDEEYKDMFDEMWPRALKALKELCER